jgi:hypothetical protein
VERLQADVHRLQEELKRSKQAEHAALDKANDFSLALDLQRSKHEVGTDFLRVWPKLPDLTHFVCGTCLGLARTVCIHTYTLYIW